MENINNREITIGQLREEIEELKIRLFKKDNIIEQKDREIRRLKEEVINYEEEISNYIDILSENDIDY